MTLETIVSRTVAWAHTVERALHDTGPWTFRTQAGITPAHRIIDRERSEIVFTGVARPTGDGVVELCSRGELVTLASADFSRGDKVTWKLSLRDLLVRAS